MFFALDSDAKGEILFPQVNSEPILMHGPIPQLDDPSNDWDIKDCYLRNQSCPVS